MCPWCHQAVDPLARVCGHCGLALDGGPTPRALLPSVAPGNVLFGASFGSSPLPGAGQSGSGQGWRSERNPSGVRLVFVEAVSTPCVEYAHDLMDACVKGWFTPLSAGARLGIISRHTVSGNACTHYVFQVSVSDNAAWCWRYVRCGGVAGWEPIAPAVALARPLAIGQMVAVELRAQGPTLRAFIDDACVLAAHDPHFGGGAVGIQVGSEAQTGPVSVICHSYEVREVAP